MNLSTVKEIKEALKSNTFNVYMIFSPTQYEKANPHTQVAYRVIDAATRNRVGSIKYIKTNAGNCNTRTKWCPISATLAIYQQ